MLAPHGRFVSREREGRVSMYPARFEYFAPATMEQAVSTLERSGDEARRYRVVEAP
jgi:hypothetical protein